MDEQGHQLIRHLQQDEEEGINMLFALYFAPLCLVALRIVHDPDAAKDVVQDVFVRLWVHRHQLQIKDSLKGYLKQSVINASIDHQRLYYEQKKVPFDQATSTHLESINVGSEETDKEAEKEATSRVVDQAIARLPARCQLVFTLSRHEGLSYKQIAQKLDISVKTVENQMNKAFKTLRKLLSSLLSIIVFLWQVLIFFYKT